MHKQRENNSFIVVNKHEKEVLFEANKYTLFPFYLCCRQAKDCQQQKQNETSVYFW